MGHKYSDSCLCPLCDEKWRKALEAALKRGEKKKKKLRRK